MYEIKTRRKIGNRRDWEARKERMTFNIRTFLIVLLICVPHSIYCKIRAQYDFAKGLPSQTSVSIKAMHFPEREGRLLNLIGIFVFR